jgi:hypothetical protein
VDPHYCKGLQEPALGFDDRQRCRFIPDGVSDQQLAQDPLLLDAG